MELTIKQACEQSANFMYLWADEQKFLQYIKKEYANNIRVKKANQRKLLLLSADKYGNTYDEYTTQIRAAFIEQYGMTPAEALVVLAQGGEVAGKNWEEGVYGIGALPTTFSGYEIDGQVVTVNAETGAIFLGADDITDPAKDVYSTSGKKTIVLQRFSKEVNGVVFMSQYYKLKKKYAPKSYSTKEGSFSAKNGAAITAADGASVWGNVLESVQVFLNWILSLFGANIPTKEQLTTENTLPNQTADGFAQKAEFTDAAGLLLILAAGGALVATGGLKKKKGNK